MEESLKENLLSQLSELEMLQSMFPNPGELKFDDNTTLQNVEKYVNSDTTEIPPFIDFTINLIVDDCKFEVSFNLSHEYPNAEPDIFIRSNKMNKAQHSEINNDCNNYINSLERGEACVYSIICWLQDNYNNYTKPVKESEEVAEQNKNELTRLWIYSHHIYNKTKRREILHLANDMKITGFCLPGKPGIICVEGYAPDCNTWWQNIKSMTWKRIFCKVTEECKCPETFLKFKSFQELAFKSSGVKSNHMDMGELYKYLEAHGLDYIFKELFGFDGKNGAN